MLILLLDLLNELGGKDKMRGFAECLTAFPNECNKFNKTGARMQDSIYHLTLKSHFISKFCIKVKSGFRYQFCMYVYAMHYII